MLILTIHSYVEIHKKSLQFSPQAFVKRGDIISIYNLAIASDVFKSKHVDIFIRIDFLCLFLLCCCIYIWWSAM